jgi:hypothetical protein
VPGVTPNNVIAVALDDVFAPHDVLRQGIGMLLAGSRVAGVTPVPSHGDPTGADGTGPGCASAQSGSRVR